MKFPWTKIVVFHGVLLSLAASFPAVAQIKPDATLPHNSLVTPKLGNVLQIDGGTRAGNNLFHSFTILNVPTGSTAFFNNALDVSNIFSRVTGGSASNIDGILKANGTASLFLMNPNGIIFGKNAQLNISGSFVATTANAIGFGTLGSFSASTPNNPSLLTVNPDSFLFNQIAAHSINSQANIQVNQGSSLLLLGGNVSLNGGTILAPGGRVELGGLAGTGTVGLKVDGTNLGLTFPLLLPRADVSLNNNAKVNVQAGGGGSIAVNARNLNILGVSRLQAGIAANSVAAGSHAGDIDLNATDKIELDGNNSDASVNAIANDVEPRATGNAGNINITTRLLNVTNGPKTGSIIAIISADSFGRGNAGDVTISATDIINIDGAVIGSQVAPRAKGNGGNINVTTRALNVTNGGIAATTFGNGNAGNVTVIATDIINIDGTQRNGTHSLIGSGVVPPGNGNGGNVNVTTRLLNISNNARLSSAIIGGANVGQGTKGKAGNINVTTRLLNITNGGGIDVFSQGKGNAGNLKILQADSINLDNQASITALTTSDEGGNITLQAGNLIMRHNSAISATAGNSGNGGNLNINANTIVALENSPITANAVRGKGGNIQINTQGVFNSSNSPITASSQYGVNGVVQINRPDVDPSRGLVIFPEVIVDASRLIAQGCSTPNSSTRSRFVATGQGGLPPNPGETLTSDAVWEDLRSEGSIAKNSSTTTTITNSDPDVSLVEATGWEIDERGVVTLTAPTPTATIPGLTQKTCHAR